TALTEQAQTSKKTSAPSNFDPRTGIVMFSDGKKIRTTLLVDASGADSIWRQRAGISCMHHDYKCAALTAEIALAAPHGQVARQIFLPDGPLALLPLPKPGRAALIWSLPTRKAQALAACDENLFNGELNAAARSVFGQLRLIGERAQQPLKAQIAEAFIGPRLALVGEAAHVIHPLAGQGMNLTLRDIGALVDTLKNARRLGLECGDATMLENYAGLRRADAFAAAFGTHVLAEIFSGPGPTRLLAAAGMSGIGYVADNWPKLKDAFRRQADQGLGPLSGLFAGSPPFAPDAKKGR
ncbi:MAG: FAD-dependent monooxygenase, partial [Pseudomonadota bacterium]|nr:FAD-dependent monooxygenase [Pseudomonadota bacterium]